MDFFLAVYVVVAFIMAVVSALFFIFSALGLRDARKEELAPYFINKYKSEAKDSIRYLLLSPIWPIAAVIGLINLVREVFKDDDKPARPV